MNAMIQNPIVSTKNLSKRYAKQFRVDHVDLNVPSNAIYGFLGPNGAGKSTTLKMLLGLTIPTNGSVQIFGMESTSKNRLELLKNTGSLIESPSYYGHLSAEDNLRIGAMLKGVPQTQIPELLSLVRLSTQKDKKVNQYSFGMKQRLGIATALLGYPKLLILDEPTNGLDPSGIQEIRELINSLPKSYGMSVIVSSHLLSEIDQMADYVGIIDEGHLIFQDSLENLHQKSQGNIAIRTDKETKTTAILSDKHIPFVLEDDYVLLPELADPALGLLIHSLFENDITIYRIETRVKSLEDIFLSLTGKEKSL
ncbi:MAG: ABC transporter ATP-binding protein [Velocimicrobium sp.]